MNGGYHTPVLLKESVDALDIKPDGVYADATFGGGGHSKEILSRMGKGGKLYGFDQDADALDNFKQETERGFETGNAEFQFVRSNFRFMPNFLKYYGEDKIDGILADLGVSSHHFDTEQRGFSFRFDAPLDMRMNQMGGETAADLLNNASDKKLAEIFRLYGELQNGWRIAQAIVSKRQEQPFGNIGQLTQLLEPLMPKQRMKKDMAKAFQALRIEVNHEMEALRDMLEATTKMLRPGGRLVVITYHSLEDRLVKNMMKTGNCEGEQEKDFYGNLISPFELVNRKVITPTGEELEQNPRARSAKLRIAKLK